MNKKKSISIDLVEKPFNSELKGDWIGKFNIKFLFLELYINKYYQKLFHYLPFINLYIKQTKVKSTIFPFVKDLYDFNIIDFNKDILYNQKKDKKEFENYYKLFRNTDKRFTYFPITEQSLSISGRISTSHAIFFIYDKLLHQIELFDSNADDFYHYKNFFKKFFIKIYGKKIKIIYPDSSCPFFSELELEKCNYKKYNFTSNGFCAIWCLWYLELRLKNEELSREQVINKALNLLKKGNQRICKLIRGYAQFVQEITKRFDYKYTNGEFILINKETLHRKTTIKSYIIPKSLITLLGISGTIIYLIKKMNLTSYINKLY